MNNVEKHQRNCSDTVDTDSSAEFAISQGAKSYFYIADATLGVMCQRSSALVAQCCFACVESKPHLLFRGEHLAFVHRDTGDEPPGARPSLLPFPRCCSPCFDFSNMGSHGIELSALSEEKVWILPANPSWK